MSADKHGLDSMAGHQKSFSFDNSAKKRSLENLHQLKKSSMLKSRLWGGGGGAGEEDSLVIKVGLDERLQVDSSSTTVYKSVKVIGMF